MKSDPGRCEQGPPIAARARAGSVGRASASVLPGADGWRGEGVLPRDADAHRRDLESARRGAAKEAWRLHGGWIDWEDVASDVVLAQLEHAARGRPSARVTRVEAQALSAPGPALEPLGLPPASSGPATLAPAAPPVARPILLTTPPPTLGALTLGGGIRGVRGAPGGRPARGSPGRSRARAEAGRQAAGASGFTGALIGGTLAPPGGVPASGEGWSPEGARPGPSEPGAGGWAPTDADLAELAEAWALPILRVLELEELAWRLAGEMWDAAQRMRVELEAGRFFALPDGGGPFEALDAYRLAKAGDSMRGKTKEQWLASVLPPQVLESASEGFAKARARRLREHVASAFPTASREAMAFEVAKRGPAVVERMLDYPQDPATEQALRALQGLPHDARTVKRYLERHDRLERERRRAIEEYGRPTWLEEAGYILYSPVRGFTFGLLDPADLREGLGIAGTAEDLRRSAQSRWWTSALVMGGELAGESLGLARAARALHALGLGSASAQVVAGGLAAGVRPDAQAHLKAGDVLGFLAEVASGGAVAGAGVLGARASEYAGLFGGIRSASARGALAGALGGALAGALIDPARGLTLEGVLQSAVLGAVAGAQAGGQGGAGGGRGATAKEVAHRPGDAADTSALLDLLARRPGDVRPSRSRTLAAFDGGEIGVAPRAVAELGRTKLEIVEGLSRAQARALFIPEGSAKSVAELATRIRMPDAEIAASAFGHLQRTGGRFITGDFWQAQALHRILGFPKGRIISVRNWDPKDLIVLVSLSGMTSASGPPRVPVTSDHP